MINKEGWKKKKLGDICTTTSGGTPNRSNGSYFNGTIPWVKSGELDKGLILDTEEKITEEALKNSSAKVFPKGTLLIALYGATIGKLAFLGIDACTNQAICGIYKNDNIDSNFLYYFLFFKKSSLIDKGIGGGQPNISQGILKDLKIPVPPLPIQQQIVSELDTLNDIISKKKQQLVDLNKLVQATFYDMFGDLHSNPNNFEVKTFNEIFSLITDGTHQTPTYTDDNINGFKFLSSKDVVSGSINWSKIKYIPESLHHQLYKRLTPQKNDILLAKNGTTGVCALVENDEVFDIYVSLALLRPKSNYNVKFLVNSINSIETKRQFNSHLKGVGVPNLHLSEIKKTKILVPPISIQIQFSDRIVLIEGQKHLINKSIDEVQHLFDYTMDRYFN